MQPRVFTSEFTVRSNARRAVGKRKVRNRLTIIRRNTMRENKKAVHLRRDVLNQDDNQSPRYVSQGFSIRLGSQKGGNAMRNIAFNSGRGAGRCCASGVGTERHDASAVP